jgi:ubiquitin-activating enzyme E1
VVIHDNSPVVISDLGTNFYLTEASIGHKRAEAVIDKLKELNPLVEVSAHTGDLNDNFLKSFGAIIVTEDIPLQQLIHINEITHNYQVGGHSNPILFLYGVNYGVTGTVFADFGPKHQVTDLDGEPARINVIDDISVHHEENGKAFLIITVAAARHGLDEDAVIQVSDVEGMKGINEAGPLKIQRVYKKMKDEKGNPRDILVLNKIRINHDDIPKWGTYTGHGMVAEVKPAKILPFKPIQEALKYPIGEQDMGFVPHAHEEKKYLGRGAQVHFTRLALWEFQKQHNHLPRLHNEEDANGVIAIAKSILAANQEIENAAKKEYEAKKAAEEAKKAEEEKKAAEEKKEVEKKEVASIEPPAPTVLTVESIDETVVKQISLYATVELPGITSFLGGVLAQEVIKKFGKYSPINQWLHLDYLELLAEKVPADSTPQNTRHDNQIAVFGNAIQQKIGKQVWFMVGCGALGCEYLKGFALMGLGANGGKLYVTDMDTIEVSNLSRQFLFRRDNVGKLKSLSATVAALKMNPKMNIEAYDVPVGPDTEAKFDDAFWNHLDGVCNALDNIKAREYTDSKCVFFRKPLLESGTLGTKANSEMVVPFKTKSYAEHEATGEEEVIPMCTLRNFPHLIEHCIEWARAQFTDLFESPVGSFNKFAKNQDEFFADVKKQQSAEALDVLENVVKLANWITKDLSYTSCINLAFNVYNTQFRERILNLIHAFPADSVKEDDNGVKIPFWSGSKRFPRASEFNPDDDLQLSFLYNTTNLYAVMYHIEPVRDLVLFKKLLIDAKIQVPEWKPDQKYMAKVQNEVKEEEAKKTNQQPAEQKKEETDEERLNTLLKTLEATDKKLIRVLEKAEFEKDNDSNFHIDFITSCSNMRAWNYHIQTATRHKCKMIAGKIIPAVATTTAMITGVVEMELYKFILGLPVEKFCNSNINLAVSDFKLFEPIGPKGAKEAYDPIENEIVVPVPAGWTCWDKVIIKGDLTVEEFLKAFTDTHHGCKLTSLFFKQADSSPIWLDFPITQPQKETVKKNTPRKLTEIYVERFGEFTKGRDYIKLDGSVQSADDKTASVPAILLFFR